MITDKEFVNKIWLQNCGDSLKVIEKTNQKKNKSTTYLWKCQFQKYPYIILTDKSLVVRGQVINPQIEIEEFVNKVWHQECGDDIKVLRKTTQTDGKKHYSYLWECEFVKYPHKMFLRKDTIIRGKVFNPKISSFSSCKERELFDYIKSIYGEVIVSGTWDELKNYEIDIYLPKEKMGFEFNGNYWHSKDIKDKNYHLDKLKLANSKGIKLYYIWEDEWDKDKNKIKQFIKDILSTGTSSLFLNDIDKIGFLEKGINPTPVLVKRNTSLCWNCGYLNKI